MKHLLKNLKESWHVNTLLENIVIISLWLYACWLLYDWLTTYWIN